MQLQVLIFSQSLGTLDILERAFKHKCGELWPHKWRDGHEYLRLDGATKAQERKQMANAFNSSARPPWVFLMSVKVSIAQRIKHNFMHLCDCVSIRLVRSIFFRLRSHGNVLFILLITCDSVVF